VFFFPTMRATTRDHGVRGALSEEVLMVSAFAPVTDTLPSATNLELTVASGEPMDVRNYHVIERISSLFEITVLAGSRNPDIDFEGVVGRSAKLSVHTGAPLGGLAVRVWTGICSRLQQVSVEGSDNGLSLYQATLVPTLWLLSQRRNYRVFQFLSELDIVLELFREWQIEPILELDPATYKKRKYRVQYAENDYAFVCRMLEDAGITLSLRQVEDETRVVLADAPERREPREPRLPYVDNPNTSSVRQEYVSHVFIGQEVRPGRYTVRDHDYRRSNETQPEASVTRASLGIEERLERYHYVPGAFLFGADRGDATPSADDRGMARTDEREASQIAERRLEAQRADAKRCTFSTNAMDLAPGGVVRFVGHPRADLAPDRKLLIVETVYRGSAEGETMVN
jgi:type VI secretion system secreted protein VgrG